MNFGMLIMKTQDERLIYKEEALTSQEFFEVWIDKDKVP